MSPRNDDCARQDDTRDESKQSDVQGESSQRTVSEVLQEVARTQKRTFHEVEPSALAHERRVKQLQDGIARKNKEIECR